ncbi:MAG: hypothetical protein M3119_06515 [Verrucomicrobiota bacterium]|nr:hypothetical protein [Verrucomicrobiota bacterium]
MMTAARFLLGCALVFAGCRAVHDVAVTSFHVIDAPAKFVRERIDQDQTTTTTTTTTVSDVTRPGAPVTAPPPRVVRREAATHRSSASTQETSRPRNDVASSATRKASSSPTPSARQSSATTTQFPTAKPVPGKPGYVYSIDPKGGIIDVTGYKSGDKAKDPYTKQIFIVP